VIAKHCRPSTNMGGKLCRCWKHHAPVTNAARNRGSSGAVVANCSRRHNSHVPKLTALTEFVKLLLKGMPDPELAHSQAAVQACTSGARCGACVMFQIQRNNWQRGEYVTADGGANKLRSGTRP
jgi:hypothetical protein